MCAEIPPRARIVQPDTRPAHGVSSFALPQAFWVALTLAMPIAGLAGWYFCGRDNFSARAMDASEHWLMLGSAALIVVLHVAMLVVVLAEPKKDRGASKRTSP